MVGKLQLEPSLNCEAMKVVQVTEVNNTTSTFKFKCADEQIISTKGLKTWYGNIDMIGRHFVLYSEAYPEVKRHYTICSTMQPDTLNALVNLADNAVN